MLDQPLACGHSLLHRIDPRVRLVTATGSAVCLALLHTREAAVAGLGMGAILLLLSCPPWRVIVRRLLAINAFLLFLCLLTPFSVAGVAAFHLGPLPATWGGFHFSLLIWLKSNALALFFLALVASIPVPTTGYALQRLHCPAKLVFLLLFAGRYIHDVAEEWQTMLTAARLRGFRARTNAHTYRTLASLLGLLLLRGYERAHRVHEAMLLRGFRQRFACVTPFHARPHDAIFALALTLGMAALVWLEFR